MDAGCVPHQDEIGMARHRSIQALMELWTMYLYTPHPGGVLRSLYYLINNSINIRDTNSRPAPNS